MGPSRKWLKLTTRMPLSRSSMLFPRWVVQVKVRAFARMATDPNAVPIARARLAGLQAPAAADTAPIAGLRTGECVRAPAVQWTRGVLHVKQNGDR